MDLTEKSRHYLLHSFLYSSSTTRSIALEGLLRENPNPSSSPSPIEQIEPSSNVGGSASASGSGSFLIEAPSAEGKIEMYSPKFYAACTVGGTASCGLTHMAVTPLDLVKCNMQVC